MILKYWKNIEEAQLKSTGEELKTFIDLPAVIILDGVVGAGKTTFVKTFISDQDGSSPTYSVINDFGNILHADFYRLKSPEDLTHLEIELYSENKEMIFIEWGNSFIDHLKYFLDVDTYSYYRLTIEVNVVGHNLRNMILSQV